MLTDKRVIERPVRISEHFAISPAGGPTFAFLPRGRADVQEANARVIAAAPTMLAALKALSRCEGRYYDTDQVTGETFERMVDAAIAAAEGTP